MLINKQIPTKGGSERITISDNVGQAADQLCREVLIVADADNSGVIRVNVGSECTASTGIPVPTHTEYLDNHIRFCIDNTEKLYFYGTADDDVVDILWLF